MIFVRFTNEHFQDLFSVCIVFFLTSIPYSIVTSAVNFPDSLKRAMAPKVVVPMDFGRHLRDSPTHNTLKLNTSEGGEVFASSVILSFNSPVIDHMTTTLHMTSVDMLEFSEAAVQVFVDAAYSGTAEGLDDRVFRDLNKMANVFEMTWLVEKCSEYFNELADQIKRVDLVKILSLFDEAAFALENLKSKSFLNVTIQKIESLQCKWLFLKTYLKNGNKQTATELSMLIELAGEDTHYLIQNVADELSRSKSINNSGTSLSFSSSYLLDNCDISSCRAIEPELFGRLFDLLGELPNEKMKWTLDLYRKAVEKPSNPGNRASRNCFKSSMTSIKKRSNMIPNLDLGNSNQDWSLDEFINWLATSIEVSSLLLAIEAVITWIRQRNICTKTDVFAELMTILHQVKDVRNWSLLPEDFNEYSVYLPVLITSKRKTSELMKFDFGPYCSSGRQNHRSVIIDCAKNSHDPFKVLSTENKLTFHFKHPSITNCKQVGYCGFILKVKKEPCETGLYKMSLCTDEVDYANESVHFHEEIRAGKMHVYFYEEFHSPEKGVAKKFHPISWFGKSQLKGMFFKSCARFKVLYYLTNDNET